jgi:hypothetical protein
MKRSACLLVIVLTACPARGTGPLPPVQPAQAGVGCPAAKDVFLASYLTHDERGSADPAGGHTGWVMPLHDLGVVTIANQPEYAAIDGTTAQALGVPTAPASVWLMVPGQPPCKATAGSYYGAAVDSPKPNVTYGVELAGCAAPPKEQQQDAEAIAVVSGQAPTECQILAPQPVAARLGETDAQKHWQRPTKATPIPPALAAVLPPHDCRAPGCEMLWAVAQVDVANRPVAWAGAVNWLAIPPDASVAPCDWKSETFAGFFVAGPDGKAVKVTEGQDHPLLLTAVLADRTGAKLLVAEGAGEYATYDLAAGTARLARHLVWLLLGADAYAIDERIGPSCGPDPDRH